MSSKNLEISPCSEAKVTSRARQREANRKLFRPWTKTKRMPFLKHENSTTPTQLVALQRAGTNKIRKLRWGDVQLQPQNGGQIVLVWLAELGTKTRHGQERKHQRAFQLKIYATNTQRDVLSVFTKNSTVTSQWKWTHQNHDFTWWPSPA